MEWKESFKISEHEKMIDDLNHISTQLENFYWYFLASIAAIGLAYKTIIGKDLELCSNQKTWMILCICLIGNIVFWLIGEYSISHGFLFRFIQSKAARTEHEVWGTSKKDPCNINKYIRFDRNGKRIFYMDHLLPDQFIPLYWASIGLISLNAIIPFFCSSM